MEGAVLIDAGQPFEPWTMRVTATVVRQVGCREVEDEAWAAYRNYIAALRAMKAHGWQIESINTHALDVERG
jgi:hypothetical protein